MSMTPNEWDALERCVTGDCEPESEEICDAIARMLDEYINGDGTGHQLERRIPKGLRTNRYPEQTSGQGNGPRLQDLDWNDARQHEIEGPNGPTVPWPTRPPQNSSANYPSWLNHNRAIEFDQQKMQDLLQQHEDNNCDDDDLPPDAEDWAQAPLPTPAQWVEAWRQNNNIIGLEDPRQIIHLANPLRKLRLAGRGAAWLYRSVTGARRAPGTWTPAY